MLRAKAFSLVSLAYVFLSFIQIFIHQGFTIAIVQKYIDLINRKPTKPLDY
jgi:Polysaccharide biosynthesis protein